MECKLVVGDIKLEWNLVVGDTKTEWNLLVGVIKIEWYFISEKKIIGLSGNFKIHLTFFPNTNPQLSMQAGLMVCYVVE